MGKPNTEQTKAAAAVAAGAVAAAAADAPTQAVGQLATAAPPALPVDEFHGKGGSYVIEDGVRRRVHEPVDAPADVPAEDAS